MCVLLLVKLTRAHTCATVPNTVAVVTDGTCGRYRPRTFVNMWLPCVEPHFQLPVHAVCVVPCPCTFAAHADATRPAWRAATSLSVAGVRITMSMQTPGRTCNHTRLVPASCMDREATHLQHQLCPCSHDACDSYVRMNVKGSFCLHGWRGPKCHFCVSYIYLPLGTSLHSCMSQQHGDHQNTRTLVFHGIRIVCT